MSGNVERDIWEALHLVRTARLKLKALVEHDTRRVVPAEVHAALDLLTGRVEGQLGAALHKTRYRIHDLSWHETEEELNRPLPVRGEVVIDLMLGRIQFWHHTLMEVGE